MRQIFIAALALLASLPPAVLGQESGGGAASILAPAADYHIHIQSLSMSVNLTPPQLPAVRLPEDFDRLLREKERAGGRVKNLPALADLYTKDALVLEPNSAIWLRGERALRYVAEGTTINRLLPTAYEVSGTAGYIVGFETAAQGSPPEPLSSFIYVLRKEADGKWRISSESFTLNAPPVAKEHTPESIIAELDAAGIRKAVALSTAFVWGSGDGPTAPDEYAKVRAENDWLAASAARFPGRLVGFCSFNPLKDYALQELARCAGDTRIRGLKFHFSDSGVDLRKPEHVEKVRRVFRAANERRLPIAAHIATLEAVRNKSLNREQAAAFLKEILPAAPDVTVQIAHLSGDTGYPESSDAALEVFAEAAAAKDPRVRNLYLDVAGVVPYVRSRETLELIARRIRQLGPRRILFASDRTGTKNEAPGDAWRSFLRLPLTEDEFRTIAGNVMPYLR